VLIGGSTYRDARLTALPGVANNLSDLAEALTDTGLWGLPKERCRKLLDCADSREIIMALTEMADLARDTFVVYYSGHGVLTEEGDFVLPTTQTVLEQAKFTSLPYAWMREIVGQCQALRRIVVLDCCFSGRALLAMSDTASAVIGQIDVDGTYVLTSAPSTSVSIAPPGARNTAFTGSLLDLIREGVPDRGEMLTLDDMYEHTLRAMVRRGWPRPQKLGTNMVGRLGILRNRAWRTILAPLREKPSPRPLSPPHRRLASGIRAAVAAAAPALGPTGQDGLELLERAARDPVAAGWPGGPYEAETSGSAEWEAGVTLVRETMTTMREQYGDGATTTAVIFGALVDGLQGLLDSGVEAAWLDRQLSVCAAQLSRELTQGTPGTAQAAASAGHLRAAILTALGRRESAEAVVAAAEAVGARNVDVAFGADEAVSAEESTFVLGTTVLAPNAAGGPIALEDPLVVVSTDGEIDVRALSAEGGSRRSGILIIAPRVSIYAARSLLHRFSQIVVVRPADLAFDLAALRDQLSRGGAGHGWCRARWALVLPGTTTIERPLGDLELSRNRITLTIADPSQFAVAVRALAVARSVADAGVVPGAGAALYAVARSHDAGGGPGASAGPGDPARDAAALVRAAACEPYRRLSVISGAAGSPDDEAVDSLATVRGALTHAVASTGRYLSAS